MSAGEAILAIFAALNFVVGAGVWVRLGALQEGVAALKRRVSSLELKGSM